MKKKQKKTNLPLFLQTFLVTVRKLPDYFLNGFVNAILLDAILLFLNNFMKVECMKDDVISEQ